MKSGSVTEPLPLAATAVAVAWALALGLFSSDSTPHLVRQVARFSGPPATILLALMLIVISTQRVLLGKAAGPRLRRAVGMYWAVAVLLPLVGIWPSVGVPAVVVTIAICAVFVLGFGNRT